MGEGDAQSEVLPAVLQDHRGSTETSPATPPPPAEDGSDTGRQEVRLFGLHPSHLTIDVQ
jgi:hypothetical protein